MSADAASRGGSGASGLLDSETTVVRLMFLLFGLGVAALLVTWLIASWPDNPPELGPLIAWGVLIAMTDTLPVQFWGRITLAVSLPMTLAVAMLYPPAVAGFVVFVASFDPREVRRQISIPRALFNRGQIAFSVTLASVVFHAFNVPLDRWPQVLVPALVAVLADFVANMALVSLAAGGLAGITPGGVIRNVLGGVPLQYLLGYASLGLLSVVAATAVNAVGMLSAVLLLVPLLLVRQSLVQSQQLHESALAIQRKNQALLDTCGRMAEERRDERMVVAGELHDEVLAPLFTVHLMGQVLRQDLTSGRLLSLDEDLPRLLEAIQRAQDAIRDLVRDLRRSSIGPGGVRPALRAHANRLESAGSPPIQIDVGEVGGSRVSQLLIYQVSREALNNAARHARARSIRVRIWTEGALTRVTVQDDGTGFDPHSVDREHHFGLQLVAERVEAAGGSVVVDSRLGSGTTIAASVPSRA